MKQNLSNQRLKGKITFWIILSWIRFNFAKKENGALMQKIFLTVFCHLFFLQLVIAQNNADSSRSTLDSTLVKPARRSLVLKPKNKLPQPTMPGLPTLSEKESPIMLDIKRRYQAAHPEEALNFDAVRRPDYYKYETPYRQPVIKPDIPVTPLQVPEKPFYQSLPLNKYILPTREEAEILEILWAKEDVMDTTIYSSLDTTMIITFEDLRALLDKMTAKGLVSRRIVSPRNEFNMFGMLIEMSPTNRRNRVYEYRSNVDREQMRKFIDANAYLVRQDSSLLNNSRLRAAKKDTSLLRDLNLKLHTSSKKQ